MTHGWTRHGHACCKQAPVGDRPLLTARCGGPGLCSTCSAEIAWFHRVREEHIEAARFTEETGG